TRFRKSTNAGRVFSILGKKNEKEGSKSPVRPGARTPAAARIGKFPPPPGPARTALGALAGTPGHVPALSGYRSHRPIRGHAPTALYRQVGMGEMSSDPRPCAGPDTEAGGARPARDRPAGPAPGQAAPSPAPSSRQASMIRVSRRTRRSLSYSASEAAPSIRRTRPTPSSSAAASEA